MRDTLHIIEPTLRDFHGHGASLVEAICAEAQSRFREVAVWSNRRCEDLGIGGIRHHRYFPLPLRRIVLGWLLVRLMSRPSDILISTATSSDMLAYEVARRLVRRPKARVHLFVHWHRPDEVRDRFFRGFARRFPEVRILTPTLSVARMFGDMGFRSVATVAYPYVWRDTPEVSTRPPRVLVPGAARVDKGIGHVVRYVEWLHEHGAATPVEIQVSLGRKPSTQARMLIQRLGAIGYPGLRRFEETATPESFREMFQGAVVLQPYDQRDFSDRVSGVTLDALAAGCPVVGTAGTWISQQVERFGAGRTLVDREPESIDAAVTEVFANVQHCRERACAGAAALRAEQADASIALLLAADD